ncbi:hypothetical protein [Salibaculum griseiflavum]|uniref:hypothetical protein n=1 Tax=Salibaculum griseiflavum TaxID=1914409 RepID=UPI0011B20428|nr:hypothetical protein [Salibaculum griseiflavum]
MALALAGPLSLSQVNTELGRAAGATISLGEAEVRGLAGLATGVIGLGALRGKSAQFTHVITSHQQELDLHAYLLAQGWDGVSQVEVTVATGIYIWSDTTAQPALDMGGAFPGGLTLVNRGFIMGKGGDGGYQLADRTSSVAPTSGGPAIGLTGPITIDNSTGYIGGGGGGGGAQTGSPIVISATSVHSPGGGGAGGGRGGPMPYGDTDSLVLSAFGPGGAIGQPGSVATGSNNWADATLPSHGGAGGASGAGAQDGSGL